MTNAGTKKIFISDIHMGDDRSQETSQPGRYPYGWFRCNIPKLANFLSEQLNAYNASEVSEVVILGDLFDEWMIPTEQAPLTSFQAICNNPANSPVLKPLRDLAALGILSYVPGNHDMTLSTTNLAGNQEFMEDAFRGIRYLADGVYRQGRLLAEHGHRYCLFNASDNWTNPPSLLPLGYFLSRLVTHKIFTTGTDEDLHDILRKFIIQLKDHPNFVNAVYEAVARDAKLNDADHIDMTGIAGFPATVGPIGSLYEQLIDNWKKNRQDITWGKALIGDGLGDLSPAADLHFGSDQNIVIFGHTHKYDLKPHPFLAAAPEAQVIRFEHPCRAIYANSGAWIDSAPCCTYVETQEDFATRRHYVRVRNYPAKTLLKEGFVKI
jgi:UDP-2,3-diacylglucosamine pyrophosphatase LpxH